jgi:Response regulator containing CheY-like receiver domain and AraC-type DNA-binding domain
VLLREGIARLLEDAGFDIVGRSGDGDDLMLKVRSYSPDVAIVDIRMPPTHTDEGLRAAAEIREKHPARACSSSRSTSSPGMHSSCSPTARRASAIS